MSLHQRLAKIIELNTINSPKLKYLTFSDKSQQNMFDLQSVSRKDSPKSIRLKTKKSITKDIYDLWFNIVQD